MPSEIELKLSFAPTKTEALKKAISKLTGQAPTIIALQNAYFDTPTHSLRKEGIAYRVRRQNDEWLQTVKCAGKVSGGLSTRPEWEYPYEGKIDFSQVTHAPTRATLKRTLKNEGLAPILNTDFTRFQWAYSDTKNTQPVLLMLDVGRITCGRRQVGICELEMELTGTAEDAAVLYQLAAKLAKKVPLFNAPLSKAARGFALLGTKQPSALLPELSANLALSPNEYRAFIGNILHFASHHYPANTGKWTKANQQALYKAFDLLLAMNSRYKSILTKTWRSNIEAISSPFLQSLGTKQTILDEFEKAARPLLKIQRDLSGNKPFRKQTH